MKTSDLISALAADAGAPVTPIGPRLALALGVGALISLALFLAMIGPRPDVMHAMHTMPTMLCFGQTSGGTRDSEHPSSWAR